MKMIQWSALGALFFCAAYASNQDLFPENTLYVGVNVGGGSTEWKYLVDRIDPTPGSTGGTTPIAVEEGGPSWGLVAGFNINKNFAIEMQYMQFADSHLTFDDDGASAYLIPNTIISKTEAYSLSAKFLVPVGPREKTHLRAFAAIGPGLVIRSDLIKSSSAIAPYVSAGLNYSFTRHFILESGFQYYTGFGATEVLPVNNFIPFAWDAYARLAYQFAN